MKDNLLTHQDEFIQDLLIKTKNTFLTVVTGPSGCGKSFAFKAFAKMYQCSSFDHVIIFDSDYANVARDYSAFKKSMEHTSRVKEHLKEGAVEAAKDTPLVGNIVSYLVGTLVKPKSNVSLHFLNDEELAIVNYIKKLAKKEQVCIICDNIHWWDRRSLIALMQLVRNNQIFTESEVNRIRFVLSITDNQVFFNAEIIKEFLKTITQEEKLTFPSFEYLNFKRELSLTSGHKLNEKQVGLLYTLVNGHLKVYFEILQELKENSFDFDISYDSNKKYLDEILDRRLKECGATGEQIAEVLAYASIIGMTFPAFELEIITDSTKDKIRQIINYSNSLRLTEDSEQTEHYKFAHDIIREIFMSKVNMYHANYYATLASCLKEIKPGQYLRRARYMMRALENEKAAILYLLEFVYQLRTYGDIPSSMKMEAIDIFSHIHKEYLSQMNIAYQAYHAKNYDTALKHLKLILSYYPEELIAERDILKLRCYSKKLATKEVITAIQLLDNKRTLRKLEEEAELSERYTHALITAYAHLGQIERARVLEEELLSSLSTRLAFDDSANHRVNVIKRNANAIHDIDISPILVNQAVEYFGSTDSNGIHKDLKQYYTALTNYSAVLIKQGDFLTAYNCALMGFELENENPYFFFSRTQILKNNFIISGVLTKKLKLSDGITLYNEMLSELATGMAERIFYTSNLSILHALNDNVVGAYQTLHDEAENHSIETDQEGLYRYRVITNMAIYQHLLGETDKALGHLENLNFELVKLINGSYFTRKNEILMCIMRQGIKSKGSTWLEIVHQHCPSYQGKPWNYFGLGYAFAALCDWGI